MKDMLSHISRMRSKASLKKLFEAVSSRINRIEFLERKREREALIKKEPRYALDMDHSDHPRWDEERKDPGWPGPGWVRTRRGGWRELGVYDG